MSVLLLIPHRLDYCSLSWSQVVWGFQQNFQNCFGFSRSFVFPYKYYNQLFNFYKNHAGILIGLFWIFTLILGENWPLNNTDLPNISMIYLSTYLGLWFFSSVFCIFFLSLSCSYKWYWFFKKSFSSYFVFYSSPKLTC